MSNYLSQPIKYAAPPTDANFELLSKVAMMQQQKYDVNHQQIQATMDAFGAMKTLRPEDDAYIAAKLNDITTQANSMGGNLANKSTSDQFLGKIKSAAQDPFIINALEQTKKMNAVNLQYQEYAKKDPSLANDKNYKDMLSLAGYDDYMAGKVDKMGTLKYNPYVDVVTTFNKKAEEYAKERGMKDQLLSSSSNQFQTTDKYGNIVTADEIQKHLYSSMTDAERTQIQINARADYQDMPQADFDKLLLDDTKSKVKEHELYGATLKSKADSKSASDKGVDYSSLIEANNKAIAENNDKINKGTFDKSEMYGYYGRNLTSDISSNYSIDRVTKIDKDNLPFEVMKFTADQEYKQQDLALKKLKIQQDALGAGGAGAGAGTATTIPTATEEVEKTGLQRIREDVKGSDAALDTYLKANDADYAQMTPQQQWNYKTTLKLNKPTIAAANPTLKTLLDNFNYAQTNYAKIIKEAKPQLTKTVADNFNNLIGGRDLNVDNLSSTMPLTASLLKNKKVFNSLTKEEQLGITAEFAANNLQYNDNLKGDVRNLYGTILDSNKAELKNLNTPKSKQILKAISESSSKEEAGSLIGNVLKGALGFGAYSILKPVNTLLKSVAYPFNLIGGEDYANAQYKSWDDRGKELGNYVTQDIRNIGKSARDTFGGQDTNVTELETGDLRNDKMSDVATSFDNLNTKLKGDIEKKTLELLPNQTETQAFTFSTQDKGQKGTASALKGALLANGVAVSNTAQDFTVKRSGDGFDISYMDKKGETLQTSHIAKLPSAVESVIDTTTQNWVNNPNNPNIALEPTNISHYDSPKDRDIDIKSFIKNSNLSREQEIQLHTNPSRTIFATKAEVVDNIKGSSEYGKDFYEKNKAEIEDILNTDYIGTPKAAHGVFYGDITYQDNGVLKTFYLPTPIGVLKDDHAFFLQFSEAMAKLRDKRIADLKK